MNAPIVLTNDPLTNIHLLLTALTRETDAADSSRIGWHLSDALGRIHVAADGFSGVLATAVDLDEQEAGDLEHERRASLARHGLWPTMRALEGGP